MELLDGFMVTIKIATVALIFSIIIGFLLTLLIYPKQNRLSWVTEKFITVMYGLPLIVVIPFVYYTVQRGSAVTIATIILMFVGAGDLAHRVSKFIQVNKLTMDKQGLITVVLIKAVGEWSRLINITSLLSIMGIAEFSRTAKIVMNSTGNNGILGFALLVYVIIHIISMSIESVLVKNYLETKKL